MTPENDKDQLKRLVDRNEEALKRMHEEVERLKKRLAKVEKEKPNADRSTTR